MLCGQKVLCCGKEQQGCGAVTKLCQSAVELHMQALTNIGQSFQQLPGQLQNAAKVFQVHSTGVPAQAPQPGPLAPAGGYPAQPAP